MVDFFNNALPWQYLNSLKRLTVDTFARYARFEGEVLTKKKNYAITAMGISLRYGGNLCIPALWSDTPMLGIFSRDGTSFMEWTLPESWKEISSVRFEAVCPVHRIIEVHQDNGRIQLSLTRGEGGWITPLIQE